MPRKKLLLGRTDKLDLPELGLYEIEAKIDTGAHSCSIHCHKIEVIQQNNENVLNFILLDPLHPAYNNKSFFLKDFFEKRVRNSFGQVEKRFIIKTPVLIYDRIINTEFSLSYRENLRYPILIGRKLLRKGFIIDVSKYNLSYTSRKGIWKS